MININKPDLTHADWCLTTQLRLIESINPEIFCEIIDYPNGKKLLFVSNINEFDISKLRFLTNTDTNNNYLYMEEFRVFNKANTSKPLAIPGITNVMMELYKQADSKAYLLGEKTFIGFTSQDFLFSDFITNGTNNFNGELYGPDINSFVDLYTNIMPFCASTKPGTKLYSLVLNPDYTCPPCNCTTRPNKPG